MIYLQETKRIPRKLKKKFKRNNIKVYKMSNLLNDIKMFCNRTGLDTNDVCSSDLDVIMQNNAK